MAVKIDGTNGFSPISPVGQCRLVYTSASVITLIPFQGNKLSFCDGNAYTIPSAGVTLSVTGLTASTLYYIYATVSGTTISLLASTTGHTTDTTYGIETQTGNANNILVGMAYPTTGPAFIDINAFRGVISWFNRRIRPGSISLSSTVSTVATSITEVEPTYRVQFLSWAGENIHIQHTGACTASIASTVTTMIFTGGSLGAINTTAFCSGTIPTGTYHLPAVNFADLIATADGLSYIGMGGATGGGTASWFGSASAATIRCTLTATTQG